MVTVDSTRTGVVEEQRVLALVETKPYRSRIDISLHHRIVENALRYPNDEHLIHWRL